MRYPRGTCESQCLSPVANPTAPLFSDRRPGAPEQPHKNDANIGRTCLQKLFDGARTPSIEHHVAEDGPRAVSHCLRSRRRIDHRVERHRWMNRQILSQRANGPAKIRPLCATEPRGESFGREDCRRAVLDERQDDEVSEFVPIVLAECWVAREDLTVDRLCKATVGAVSSGVGYAERGECVVDA